MLGQDAVLGGNPVTLTLSLGLRLDTDLSATFLGEAHAELLEGLDFTDHAPFDAWLTIERHRLRHAVETLVYSTSSTSQPARATPLSPRLNGAPA